MKKMLMLFSFLLKKIFITFMNDYYLELIINIVV